MHFIKTLLITCLIASADLILAQTTPARTKIYLLNLTYAASNVSLETTLNINSPINIGYRRYALIETDADSLDLFIGRNATQPVPFETGKTYYFIVANGDDYQSGNRVSEVSEREFWLSAAVNELRKSQTYFLSKDSGLTVTSTNKP